MPVKMRHTYIVIVINNHIIKEILLKSLIGCCELSIEFYCYMLEVTRKNQILFSYLKDEKDTFTNYIMIWYIEGIHNYAY